MMPTESSLPDKPGCQRIWFEYIPVPGERQTHECYVPSECIALDHHGLPRPDDARQWLREVKGYTGVIDAVWFY